MAMLILNQRTKSDPRATASETIRQLIRDWTNTRKASDD